MKDIVRKIHLYSGLSLLVFMIMYFLSAFMMMEGKLFPPDEPVKQTRMEQVQIPDGLDFEQTGSWLAERFDLRGKPQPLRNLDDGKVRFAFNRPGINTRATLDADRARVEITTTKGSFRSMMGGFHHMLGYGTNLVWNLWALLVDLASIGCIVFATSGIWVWATSRERDKTSWVMFICGWSLTVGMVIYLIIY